MSGSLAKRRLVGAILATVLSILARGAEAGDRPLGQEPRETAKASGSDRERPSTVDRLAKPPELNGCFRKNDLACAVVHVTKTGIVVVTASSAGRKQGNATWSVVNYVPPGAATAGGTIYVVPTVVVEPPQPAQYSANDAPILD
jgi:hypothetical protein